MKNIYSLMAILLVLTLVLVGCSSDDSVQEPAATQEVPKSQQDTPKKEDPIVKSEEYETPMDKEVYSGELLELMQSKHYTVKMNTAINKDREINMYETITIVDGDRSVTSMKSMASSSIDLITILKDSKAYVIKPNEKTIIVSPIEDNEEKIGVTLDEIDFNKIEYLGKGKGLYGNQPTDFEEYKVDAGFVRYYYDGNELKAMEVITDDGITLMNHQSFSEEVDPSAFELPKDYKQIGN